MPAIFIYAFLAFVVLVVVFIGFLVVFKGYRPSRSSSMTGDGPGGGDSMGWGA